MHHLNLRKVILHHSIFGNILLLHHILNLIWFNLGICTTHSKLIAPTLLWEYTDGPTNIEFEIIILIHTRLSVGLETWIPITSQIIIYHLRWKYSLEMAGNQFWNLKLSDKLRSKVQLHITDLHFTILDKKNGFQIVLRYTVQWRKEKFVSPFILSKILITVPEKGLNKIATYINKT